MRDIQQPTILPMIIVHRYIVQLTIVERYTAVADNSRDITDDITER